MISNRIFQCSFWLHRISFRLQIFLSFNPKTLMDIFNGVDCNQLVTFMQNKKAIKNDSLCNWYCSSMSMVNELGYFLVHYNRLIILLYHRDSKIIAPFI